MSILDKFARSVANRAQTRGATIVGGVKSNLAGQAIGASVGLIARTTDMQSALFEKALDAVNASSVLGETGGKVLGNIGQQLGLRNPGAAAGLERQASGRLGALGSPEPERISGTAAQSLGIPGGTRNARPSAMPFQPGPSGWSPAPLWGMLTANDYRQLWIESAQIQKAWKNLWYIDITDFETTEAAVKGTSDALNILALDVSFAPFTISGEAVPMGAAVLDSVTGSERVELRLTTLDDAKGSIKRWLRLKAGQVAHTDGTFGKPKDYLVNVKITHMDPGNEWGKDDRFRHRWIMRFQGVENELSRRSSELEELQISFVEFDTFYPRGPKRGA